MSLLSLVVLVIPGTPGLALLGSVCWAGTHDPELSKTAEFIRKYTGRFLGFGGMLVGIALLGATKAAGLW